MLRRGLCYETDSGHFCGEYSDDESNAGKPKQNSSSRRSSKRASAIVDSQVLASYWLILNCYEYLFVFQNNLIYKRRLNRRTPYTSVAMGRGKRGHWGHELPLGSYSVTQNNVSNAPKLFTGN